MVRVSSGAGGCAGGACSVGMAGDVGAAMGSGCGDRADSGGAGGRLVGVSAATADVGAVVVLVAVPVPASVLVAITAPAVVIALTPAVLGVAAIPASDVATAAVLS